MRHLKNNFNNEIAKPITLFDVNRENNILTFRFTAKESSLISYSNKNNDSLWRGNVVEVFLDLGDDFYYEFEVAPNGATFVATILNRKITFIENNFFTSKVTIEGSTYKVEMSVDLNKINNPKIIRYNVFRIEVVNDEQVLEALNPTLCETFHVREKFIDL